MGQSVHARAARDPQFRRRQICRRARAIAFCRQRRARVERHPRVGEGRPPPHRHRAAPARRLVSGRRRPRKHDGPGLLAAAALHRAAPGERGRSCGGADVDLVGKTLTIRDTKNHQPHTLPLPDFLFDLLSARQEAPAPAISSSRATAPAGTSDRSEEGEGQGDRGCGRRIHFPRSPQDFHDRRREPGHSCLRAEAAAQSLRRRRCDGGLRRHQRRAACASRCRRSATTSRGRWGSRAPAILFAYRAVECRARRRSHSVRSLRARNSGLVLSRQSGKGAAGRRYDSLSISERYTVRPYQAGVTVTVPGQGIRRVKQLKRRML